MARTSHVYDYRVLPGSVGAIVPDMLANGATVLELGPGPGVITRLLHAKGCKVTGLELDPTCIPLVSPFCERVFEVDLNSTDWDFPLGDMRFDAVVMTDVLEHLLDPWATLSKAAERLAPHGAVIASLPHISHSGVLASLLAERFDYGPSGLLDRTHIRFFALNNVKALFDCAGLKIVAADFVVRLPEQTEFASAWRRLSKATRQALASNPYGNVYQCVVKAVPKQSPSRKVDLLKLALPNPAPGNFGGNRVVRFIVSFLSLETRRRIANALGRLGIQV